MLFNLQRRWTGKFKATMVFALRLPFVIRYLLRDALHQAYTSLHRIIIIAIYRLLSLRDFRSSTDPFLDRILPIAWAQGEQAYSFATAIIPSLMPFLTKLNTGLGALSREDFVKETTRQESSGSYAMQSLKPSQRASMVSLWQMCDVEGVCSDGCADAGGQCEFSDFGCCEEGEEAEHVER
jgi:hypothetical protein